MGTTTIEALALRIEASATKLEKDMAKNQLVFDRGAKRMEAQAKTLGTKIGGRLGASIQSSFSGFALRSGGMLAAAFSVDKLFGATQSYARIKNQLTVAGLSGDKLNDTFDQLYEIAQKQGAPLETLVELYSKAAQAQDNLGASSAKLVSFADAVAKALRVSGKSASESSGALLQLGQAISGNVIQSQEYNSLIDGAYPLLQAAAAGIKETGGSVSTLTKLVKDGKVAAKAFFDGILAGSPILTDKLAGAEDTAAQAGTRWANALVRAVGKIDEAVGISAKVISSLNDSAAYLDANADDWAKWADKAVKEISKVKSELNSFLAKAFLEFNYKIGALERPGSVAPKGDIGGPAITSGLVGDTETPAARIGVAFDAVDKDGKPSSPEALVSALADRAAAAGNKITPVSLADYDVKKTDGSAGKGRSPRDRYAEIVASAKQYIAEQQVEASAVGKTAEEAARLTNQQDLLNEAQRAGIALTPQQRAELMALASEMATAEKNAQDLAKAQQEATERQQFFAETLANSISEMIVGGESAADVMENLAKTIANAALQAALLGSGPLASLMGTSGTGLLTSLFKAIGFDEGGYTGSGGKNEPAGIVHRGEYVFDAATVRKLGVGNLETMRRLTRRGYASGGYVGGALSTSVPTLTSAAGSSSSSSPQIALSMTVNTPDATSFRRSQAQVSADLVRMMQRAKRVM